MIDWPTASVIITSIGGVIVAFVKIIPKRESKNGRSELVRVAAEVHYVKKSFEEFRQEVRETHKDIRGDLKSLTDRFMD